MTDRDPRELERTINELSARISVAQQATARSKAHTIVYVVLVAFFVTVACCWAWWWGFWAACSFVAVVGELERLLGYATQWRLAERALDSAVRERPLREEAARLQREIAKLQEWHG